MVDDVGEQDVFAAAQRVAVDPDQAEQRADEALDLVVLGLLERDVVGRVAPHRCLHRSDDVERYTGR